MNRFALTVAMTLLVSALRGGVAELRALGPDEAGDVRQVELSAVVTGVYPGTKGRCFVLSDDAKPGSPGIYANASDGCSPFPAKPLEPGDKRLEVGHAAVRDGDGSSSQQRREDLFRLQWRGDVLCGSLHCACESCCVKLYAHDICSFLPCLHAACEKVTSVR